MVEWLAAYQTVLWWVAGVSLGIALGSVILIPWFVMRIPADYFCDSYQPTDSWASSRPLLRLTVLVGKNVLGAVLLIAGIAMLFLPGQGLLTILAALMLMNFPKKRQLEQCLARRPAVRHALNWLRVKAKHPPLIAPPVKEKTKGR